VTTSTSTNGTVGLADVLQRLAKVWPAEGGRHAAYRALAGGLLRGGIPQDEAEHVVEDLCEATGDDESAKRIALVGDTATKLKDGKQVTGWPALAKQLGSAGDDVIRRLRCELGLTITLESLAAHKQLTVEFLQSLGLHDLEQGGVGITYHDTAARQIAIKQRTALRAGDGSFWPKGVSVMAYGESRIDAAVQAGYLVLVEGESDSWTLWHHGYPALGLPGADTVAKTLAIGHLGGIKRLFVAEEADAGGKNFVANVASRLREIGWRGEALVVRLGVKDVSELHLQCPDAAEFRRRFQAALDRAEPLPAPAEAGGSAEPWPEPVPLSEVPAAAPLPLEVFPEVLQGFVRDAAAAFPCPPDYVAVPLIVVAGGALGAARELAVKESHKQRASCYAAVIGPPGSAKTPAMELVVEPLLDVGDAARAEWKARMGEYEAQLDDYESELKEWKKTHSGDRPKKPERPTLDRTTVDDFTTEALVRVLQENPRGVTLPKDELVAWVLSMNAYRQGKGSDQQFFLSAWSGKDYTGDRSGTHEQGPLCVRRPFLSIVGGLTPDNLTVLRGDVGGRTAKKDGHLDRLLLSYPREPEVAEENWAVISERTRQTWAAVVAKIRTLEMVPVTAGGLVVGHRPYLVKLTDSGRQAWRRYTRAHAAEVNAEDFPRHLKSPWSKFKGYCARLALILHVLRWACGEDCGEDVDGESLNRAATLVAYFKSHARKVYAAIDASPSVGLGRRLLDWIRRESKSRFTRRNAYRALRPSCSTVADVDPVLALLADHGFIRPLPSAGPVRSGRKASPEYEAHPSLLDPTTAPEGDSVHCGHSVHEDEADEDGVWEGDVP
jgi:hypothetical protein